MWSFCGWWGVGCSFYIRFLEIRILYDIYIEYSIGPSWTSTTLDSISLWEPRVWKAPSLVSGSHPSNLVRRLVNSQKTVKDWWNAALETSQIRFAVKMELSQNGIGLQRSSCTSWLPTAFHGGSSSSPLGSASSSCSSSPTFSRTSSTKDSGWDFPCLQLQLRCRLFLLQMSSTRRRTVT